MTADAQPATRALNAEVKKKVAERGLVLWLDADGDFTPFVDAMGESGFAYPVVALRGSFLELMLALKDYGSGLHPEHLLVHLPGLNKEAVKETPIYELYAAGTLFEKNLGTLVREVAVGLARPDEVEAFVRAPELSLSKAETWLAGLRDQPRDGIALLTEGLGLDDTVLALLAGDRRFAAHLPERADALLAFLEKGLGLSSAWRAFRLGDAELRPEAMAALVSSWLMAMEFVHDLKEPAVTPALRALAGLGPFAKESRRLAARFRDRLPDAYEELAGDLQSLIAEERTSHHAEALGTIDTFRFEESTTRDATIRALQRGAWDVAEKFAEDRTPEHCFWVKRSLTLQRTWELLRLAAAAGRAFAATVKNLDRCGSLDEATQRYADKLAPVDRVFRHLEQRAHALLTPELEDYDALLEVRSSVRAAHRAWSDAVNRAFYDLCIAHGPLPDPSLRQRTIYDEVIQPRLERGGKLAYFMVDALRFEMAQGLAAELKREKYQVTLTPRLAELPTETSVGMNALAPVAEGGRLRVVLSKSGAIEGFKVREFTVRDPASRVRRISERSLQAPALDLMLDEFRDMSLVKLERKLVGKPPLVVVRSRELDEAGESNLHLGTFDQTLTLLKSALSLLSQAGIEQFVLCSDHGFLMQDSTTANVELGASKRVPKRRHALLDRPSGKPDVLEVRLADLEYDSPEDLHLVLAPDTALWKTRDEVAAFVHGGNSLQERVVPVLVLERTITRGRTTTKYEVVARPEPAHLGRQRLKIAVRLQSRETATLGFLAPKMVSLALRVPGRPELRPRGRSGARRSQARRAAARRRIRRLRRRHVRAR